MTGTCTVQCWGCNKSETHPLVHGEEYKTQREEWASRGWRRKAFWPADHPGLGWDKGPWFCSEDCATNSYNAKQAQEYWDQKEFEEYAQKAFSRNFWLPFIFIGIVLGGFLLEECFHAGLQ